MIRRNIKIRKSRRTLKGLKLLVSSLSIAGTMYLSNNYFFADDLEQASEEKKLEEDINSDFPNWSIEEILERLEWERYAKTIVFDLNFENNIFVLDKIRISYLYVYSIESPGTESLYYEILSKEGDLLEKAILPDPRVGMVLSFPLPVSIEYIDSGSFTESLPLIKGADKIKIYGLSSINDKNIQRYRSSDNIDNEDLRRFISSNSINDRSLSSINDEVSSMDDKEFQSYLDRTDLREGIERLYREQNTKLLLTIELEGPIKKYFSKKDGICDPDYRDIDVDCENEK